MANDPEIVESITTRLFMLGPVMARRMFGGHGVFLDGRMFALIAGDALYLKADDENRRRFTGAGAAPFAYDRRGKRAEMSYYSVPAHIFDDEDALLAWAEAAVAAAKRQSTRKRKKPGPGR